MNRLEDIDVRNQRVFLRVDFNVPLDDQQRITDDTRIRYVVPTIRYLLEQGARLIVASHLGRPKGKPHPTLRLRPAAERLGEILQQDVQTAPDCIGEATERQVSSLDAGEVIVLENLRFHPEEEANDPDFARRLAGLCDVYVNDAFAVSHRANASVVAITDHVRVRAAGYLLEKELSYFAKALSDPRRPLVAVIGGAKVSSKLGALKHLLERVDKILIGGAMANTFLRGLGKDVGRSKIEEDMIGQAAEVIHQAEKNRVRLYLPVDVVAADGMEQSAQTRCVPVDEIPKDLMALDIGPASAALFCEALHDAGTIVWNGPMGLFEMEPFRNGTQQVAAQIARSEALSIAGGGDTVAAIHTAGVAEDIGYISTGGGAFLTLLEGKTLVAVDALR
ncbi:MAG: phosphoglycerate kinase [Desulfobacteraceae bacterium]|nr:phosphoglycerate kinase [Desulfobacteraceae bacterium]